MDSISDPSRGRGFAPALPCSQQTGLNEVKAESCIYMWEGLCRCKKEQIQNPLEVQDIEARAMEPAWLERKREKWEADGRGLA